MFAVGVFLRLCIREVFGVAVFLCQCIRKVFGVAVFLRQFSDITIYLYVV